MAYSLDSKATIIKYLRIIGSTPQIINKVSDDLQHLDKTAAEYHARSAKADETLEILGGLEPELQTGIDPDLARLVVYNIYGCVYDILKLIAVFSSKYLPQVKSYKLYGIKNDNAYKKNVVEGLIYDQLNNLMATYIEDPAEAMEEAYTVKTGVLRDITNIAKMIPGSNKLNDDEESQVPAHLGPPANDDSDRLFAGLVSAIKKP